MYLRIGIIVEGPSDKLVLETLLTNVGIKLLVRIAGGSKILTTSVWIASRLYDDGADNVIVLKDSDCHAGTAAYQREVTTRLGNIKGVTVCLAVHAIESWLMADEEALGKYLGAPVKEIPNPEKYCLPDDELNDVFRRIKGRSYLKRSDASGIASYLRIERVRQRCPSFANFIQTLGVP